MNILFIHHRYHTNLFNWFRGFQENGHNVKLLVYKADEVNQPDLPHSDYLPPSKRSVKKMKKNPRTRGDGVDSFSPYYYPSFKSLYHYFKVERPDLVVIRPVFSRFGYMILLLALWFRSKIVFHSRIRIHRLYRLPKLLVFKIMMRLLNAHWMSPCKGDPEKYTLASKRLVYFPFLIEPKVELREYFKNEKVNILCVAKYFKSKNPKMMLEVFLKLRKQFEDIELTICGTGDPQGEYYLNMKKMVDNSEFQNDIKLLINQPLEAMSDLYKSNDVFVLPTRHDPASFTVLEAMAHGLMTITTTVDGASGYIEEGRNGFVFDPSKITNLENLMHDMISERNRIPERAEYSFHLVKQRHDPVKVTSEFLSICA